MTARLRRTAHLLAVTLLASLAVACAPQAEVAAPVTAPPPVAATAPQTPPALLLLASDMPDVTAVGRVQRGEASYYARKFNGRLMANGQRFDPQSDSVAHRTLPFGTVVLVRNRENGRTTIATVQDRGPFIRGRIIDLSPKLARDLDMIEDGVVSVEVTPVERGAQIEVAEAP